MSVSPIQYSSQEMNRVVMTGYERVHHYSRKSSIAMSDEDSSDHKISKRMITCKIKDFVVPEKQEISLVTKLVQNIYFQIFITLLTLVSLVLYDVKTIFLSKEQDFTVGIINLALFGIFMIEIIMNIKTEGYFCSFYFYLDLISTITLLLDVDMITDILFNQSTSSSFQVNSLIAKSKASRAAARAVRVVKIFRLARVAKLYKSSQKARQLNEQRKKQVKAPLELIKRQSPEDKQSDPIEGYSNQNFFIRKETNKQLQESNLNRYEMNNDIIKEEDPSEKDLELQLKDRKNQIASKHNFENQQNGSSLQMEEERQEGDNEDMQKKESNISKILSDDSIKRIIIIILILMISIPLMDVNNYLTISTHWDFMTSFIFKLLQNKSFSIDQINSLINKNIEQFQNLGVNSDVLCFDTPFDQITSCPVTDFEHYRTNDLGMFTQAINTTQILLLRPQLIVTGAQTSMSSEDQIVIFLDYSRYNRIDAIFSIITTLFICLTIMYLLTSFSNNISQLIISPIQKMLELVKPKDSTLQLEEKAEENDNQQYETQMVQTAIVKIKNLMQTIFGALGNQMVQEKMQNNQSIRQNIDQSLDKALCAFVICKVNNIQTISEVLGDDIFGFSNDISTIVLNAAYRYGGYCAKVLDNGYLLAFKIPNEELLRLSIKEEIDPRLLSQDVPPESSTYIKIVSDFAFFTPLKILARLCKEHKIFKYRNDQRLLVSFKGSFNVEMSFALTLGWASEAIVGSSYKIDPIFFGPEINKLNKLLKLCKKRGSSIVVAESLYENMTSFVKSYCRGLQSIKFQEREQIERVFLVDFDTTNVSPSRRVGEKVRKDLKQKKQQNIGFLQPSEVQNYNSDAFINNKKELRQILKRSLGRELTKRYKLAFEHYVRGEWNQCLQLLEHQKLQKDSLAERLKFFIKSNHGVPPSTWKGYRPFQSLLSE